MQRLLRHLFTPFWVLRLRYPAAHLQQIEARIARLEIEHLDELWNRDCDPAIAARPKRPGKVVPAVEGPTVKPQTRATVMQVLHVQHELPPRFLQVL